MIDLDDAGFPGKYTPISAGILHHGDEASMSGKRGGIFKVNPPLPWLVLNQPPTLLGRFTRHLGSVRWSSKLLMNAHH